MHSRSRGRLRCLIDLSIRHIDLSVLDLYLPNVDLVALHDHFVIRADEIIDIGFRVCDGG